MSEPSDPFSFTLSATDVKRAKRKTAIHRPFTRKKEFKPEKHPEFASELSPLIEGITILLSRHSAKIDSISEEELPKISSAIESLIEKLDKIEERIERIEEMFREHESVIIVKEIPFDEAKKMVEEYIMRKEDEFIDPLEIAEALQIPYEQAHEIFLMLVKEGKLKLEE